MHINDLIPENLLVQCITDGYVRRQEHPSLPLALLNYSEKAQFERAWNTATLNSRGLIYNGITGEIVARPFAKFFNHNEPEAPKFSPEDDVRVFDKLDGSLGILYTYNHEIHVATRGSFKSEQAQWATNHLHSRLTEGDKWDLILTLEDYTVLTEIIYRENRIVLDYGDFEGLAYLGEISIEQGDFLFDPTWHSDGVFTRHTEVLYEGPYSGIDLSPREAREGLVIVHGNDRVKYKYEDYLRLHKIVTGLNRNTVSEAWAEDRVESLISSLPDEFHRWVEDVVDEIKSVYVGVLNEADAYLCETTEVLHNTIDDNERRAVALHMNDRGFSNWAKTCVFRVLDNKPFFDILKKETQRRFKEEQE